MKNVERPFLYIMVFFCLLNTCGSDQQRVGIIHDLEDTKTNLKYAIYLLEGGEADNYANYLLVGREPRTPLDCTRSTDTVIDCRPVE